MRNARVWIAGDVGDIGDVVRESRVEESAILRARKLNARRSCGDRVNVPNVPNVYPRLNGCGDAVDMRGVG